MGKANDGASKQKKGKAQASEKKGKQVYCAIFIDDYFIPTKEGKIRGQQVPSPDSTLACFFSLYTHYRPKDLRTINKYIQGPGSVVGTGLKLDKTRSLDLVGPIKGPWMGFGWDHSVVNNIKEAVKHIEHQIIEIASKNYKDLEVNFELFGSGRGAFAVRVLAYLLNVDGNVNQIPEKLRTRYDIKYGKELCPLKQDFPLSQVKSKKIRMMGLLDTIACMGLPNTPEYDYILKNTKSDLNEFGRCRHDQNVDDFGLYATQAAENVLHICAMDENRMFYPLVDIDNSLSKGTEIFLPGCHNDIVGGNLGGVGFVTSCPMSLYDTFKREVDHLHEQVLSLADMTARKDFLETAQCLEKYKAKQYGKQMLLDANDVLTKNNDWYYGGDAPRMAIALHAMADRFDMEVERRKDWNREKINKSQSKNNAKELIQLLKKIADQTEYIGKHFSNILRDCKDIEKAISRIPPIDQEWLQIKRDGYSACGKTIRQLDPESKRYNKLPDFIDDLIDRIEDEEDWIFGEQRPEVVMSNNYPFVKPTDSDLMPVGGKVIRGLGWVQDLVITKDHYIDKETGKVKIKNFDYSESATDIEDNISSKDLKTIMGADISLTGTGVFNSTCRGYSMVAQKLLWKWVHDIDSKQVSPWPPDSDMPKDLETFFNGVSSVLGSKGRVFCYPDDNHNDGYRTLRCKYLQFSLSDYSPAYYFATDAATYDNEINPKKNIITRRVYPGAQGQGNTKKYIFDYSVKQHSVACDFNPDLDDHWIVSKRDGSKSDKWAEHDKKQEEKRKREEEAKKNKSSKKSSKSKKKR